MSAKTLTASSLAELIDDCQAAIGYAFHDPALLRAALTHTSGANTRQASNERLEFLGDSVLGLITCELLYARFPTYQEGELTKVKSAVVSRRTCAEFSRELNLADFLILGKGVGTYGELPSNILADVYEALVAAVFLDGGYDAAKTFVLPHLEVEVERSAADAVANNAKSKLQQVVQREYADTPRYLILDEQGPDHNKCFKMAAECAGHRFAPASGRRERPGGDRRQPRPAPDGVMPLLPYRVGCSGCATVAAYKVAARWSDGATAELKTYALSCRDCLPVLLARARVRWAACRRADGETLELPAVYELGGQVRRADLEM